MKKVSKKKIKLAVIVEFDGNCHQVELSKEEKSVVLGLISSLHNEQIIISEEKIEGMYINI